MKCSWQNPKAIRLEDFIHIQLLAGWYFCSFKKAGNPEPLNVWRWLGTRGPTGLVCHLQLRAPLHLESPRQLI